jgi:hypothetical protein
MNHNAFLVPRDLIFVGAVQLTIFSHRRKAPPFRRSV